MLAFYKKLRALAAKCNQLTADDGPTLAQLDLFLQECPLRPNCHFFNRFQQVTLVTAIGLLVSFIAGCGEPSSFQSKNEQTGQLKTVVDADTQEQKQVGYTLAGSKAAYAALEQKIAAHLDLSLTSQLTEIEVEVLQNNQLKVKMAGSFQISMTSLEKTGSGTTTQNGVTLSAQCLSEKCQLLELIREQRGKKVGALVARNHPQMSVVRSPTLPRFNELPLKKLESFQPSASAHINQTTVVVIRGPSYTQISVTVQNELLLKLKADLLDTESAVTEVLAVAVAGVPSARAKLIGNDSSTGDLLFELVVGREVAILAFEEAAADSSPVRNRSLRMTSQALFPTSAKNKNGLRMAHDFAAYGEHERTRHYMEFVLKKDQKGVRNVFAYAHNVSPYISKVFESQQMTPEFAYLLPVESAYLKGGQFNAQQVTGVKPSAENQNPSAYGPWQIINKTAFGIKEMSRQNFNIVFIRNKQPDPNDDRGFLVQSTYMASIYLQKLNRLFPQDAAMAIMAYHAGEFGVCDAVDPQCTSKNMVARLRHLASRNVNLAQVEKYKMIEPIHRNYAFLFLAWRELGQNPNPYGLHKIQKIKTDAYKKRLSRPGAPSPIAI